jgi:hypothetical protein
LRPNGRDQIKEFSMQPHPAIRHPLLASALAVLLAGCADLNDTGLAALSYKVPAYAVVDAQLVQGEMVLFPNHTGTITLRGEAVAATGVADANVPVNSAGKPPLTNCVGRMRYTATTAGSIDLRCNDGAIADLRMALIGETRGYGYGQTATGLASLVFGMTPVESRAHLTVPPGKQLLERTEPAGLELK